MELEQQFQISSDAQDSKQLVEKLENIEISSDVFDSKMACLQYFSYILTWDIVNARFFYYKYKNLIDAEQIGKEMTKFLKLVFENKYSEFLIGCNQLCELLKSQQVYLKWIDELVNRVNLKLNNLIHQNFNSISAVRLSSFGTNPKGKAFINIEPQEQENIPIDIEKLSQMARLIQNMGNK